MSYTFFSEVIHFICATCLAQLKSTNVACVELVVLDSSTAKSLLHLFELQLIYLATTQSDLDYGSARREHTSHLYCLSDIV